LNGARISQNWRSPWPSSFLPWHLLFSWIDWVICSLPFFTFSVFFYLFAGLNYFSPWAFPESWRQGVGIFLEKSSEFFSPWGPGIYEPIFLKRPIAIRKCTLNFFFKESLFPALIFLCALWLNIKIEGSFPQWTF